MKACARLILFYTITFVCIAALGTAARLGYAWLAAFGILPGSPFHLIRELATAARDQFMLTVYACVLFASNHAVRHRIGRWLSGIVLFILTAGALFAGAWGLAAIDASPAVNAPLAVPDYAFAGRFIAYPSAVVVLGGGPVPYGVADQSGAALRLVPVTADAPELGGAQRPALVDGIGRSSSLTGADAALRSVGAHFRELAGRGWAPLGIYVLAFALCLASLRALAGFSVWPVADVVFGCLALSALTLLESSLRAPAIARFLAATVPFIPAEFMSAAPLAAVALVIIVGSGLAALAGGRRAADA